MENERERICAQAGVQAKQREVADDLPLSSGEGEENSEDETLEDDDVEAEDTNDQSGDNNHVSLSATTTLPSGKTVEEIAQQWRRNAPTNRDSSIRSYILYLNDPAMIKYFDTADVKYLTTIWRATSTAATAFQYLEGLLKVFSNYRSAASLYDDLAGKPLREPAQGILSHPRTLAVKEMTMSVLRDLTYPSQGKSEAAIMKQSWDGLFDKLASGTVRTTAAENTVLASKHRICKVEGSTNRGKQADKCWIVAGQYEICWQEASKSAAVEDSKKATEDLLKVHKGSKDMPDLIFEQTGKSVEVFGLPTSGASGKILSAVRLPSGIIIAKDIVRMTASANTFGDFHQWIESVRISLCIMLAMEKIGSQLTMPSISVFSDSDEDITIPSHLPTQQTPEKPKRKSRPA
ncbi:hypothetical protein DFS34DRAFT_697212 [Phlyctochytrium arcticum]|nr:hypothetical protein DFS34DRAFT_697212 [Phlyctochytrium arcticum]